MSFTQVDFTTYRVTGYVMKRNPGLRNKKCGTTRVFFWQKKAKECDVWCHERFQPRSGVRYFNWNIVPRSTVFWWKLFHLRGPQEKRAGVGITKDQMLGKLKIAHRWPTQNTKNLIYHSSDGLSRWWPLWQIYIYRKFTDCDQAENPGAILAFHHYKARMFD